MIQQYSRLKVADNTGARVIQCIRVIGRSQKTTAGIGDVRAWKVSPTLPDDLKYSGRGVTAEGVASFLDPTIRALLP